MGRMVAGATAGVIAMSSTYPLEMVRGRITIQEGGRQIYSGLWDALSTIYRKEGALTLFRGWLPSVLGSIPYAGFNFAVYETFKVWVVKWSKMQSDRELSVGRLGCGCREPPDGAWIARFWWGSITF